MACYSLLVSLAFMGTIKAVRVIRWWTANVSRHFFCSSVYGR